MWRALALCVLSLSAACSVSRDEDALAARLETLSVEVLQAHTERDLELVHLDCSDLERHLRDRNDARISRLRVRWNDRCQVGVRHAMGRLAIAGSDDGLCARARGRLQFLLDRARAVDETRSLLTRLDEACHTSP